MIIDPGFKVKVGDRFRVPASVVYDPSERANEQVLRDVLLDVAPRDNTDTYLVVQKSNRVPSNPNQKYLIQDNKFFLIVKI